METRSLTEHIGSNLRLLSRSYSGIVRAFRIRETPCASHPSAESTFGWCAQGVLVIPCLSKTEKYLSHQIINIAIVHTFSFWWLTQGRFPIAKGSAKIPIDPDARARDRQVTTAFLLHKQACSRRNVGRGAGSSPESYATFVTRMCLRAHQVRWRAPLQWNAGFQR